MAKSGSGGDARFFRFIRLIRVMCDSGRTRYSYPVMMNYAIFQIAYSA